MGKIIDGKAIALKIREGLIEEIKALKAEKGLAPKLSVVLVGDDPASQVYVGHKERGCRAVGIISETIRKPASIGQKELITVVKNLNADPSVHGLLVQLPLPKGLDAIAVLNEIDPAKDVDGLHPMNMGKLLRGEEPPFVPCTPSGIMELLLSTGVEFRGKEAVVVGRSNIVGKPMSLLLLSRHCTVTICHSRTRDLGEVCRRADILVASVGKSKIVQGDWVKEGAIVIDVGVNRVEGKLIGDVDFEAAKERASYITPVPGGVGPMTIIMLLKSTLKAAKTQALS
ncbi:MAG: bifunctional methylenetetrahydrofolate dehydrogenase/methenyltetrahydrofolate cyclohydrolase FolD [bacterium]